MRRRLMVAPILRHGSRRAKLKFASYPSDGFADNNTQKTVSIDFQRSFSKTLFDL